ncbi:MAG: hypothetical protein RJA49_3146 [Actinomycetota bacterium]
MGAAGSIAELGPEPTMDTGMPGIIGVFFFLFVLVCIGVVVLSVVKFKATRDMAIRKGATSTEATAVALSGDLGTTAAFYKPGAVGTAPAPAAPASTTRSAADRIREVRSLEAQGLITAEQAEARVGDILKGV